MEGKISSHTANSSVTVSVCMNEEVGTVGDVFCHTCNRSASSVVPNLGPPDVLGLQLPEILASRGSGEGFWEL